MWQFGVADVDLDGQENVVLGGDRVLTVLDNRLQEQKSIQEDGTVHLVKDLFSDGFCEIVTVNKRGKMRIYDYTLELLATVQLASEGRVRMLAGDLNLNGRTELIAVTPGGMRAFELSEAARTAARADR
jgi:hypothetical protein